MPPGASPNLKGKFWKRAAQNSRIILGANRDERAVRRGSSPGKLCRNDKPNVHPQCTGRRRQLPPPLSRDACGSCSLFSELGRQILDLKVLSFLQASFLQFFRFCCFVFVCYACHVQSPITAFGTVTAVTWPAIFSRAIFRLPFGYNTRYYHHPAPWPQPGLAFF